MTKNIAVKIALPALMLAAFAGPLSTGLSAQAARSGISRSMEQAIRLYHEGQDTEAMDRFMDILVKGTPSEKALANEYITKITLRMNTGVNTIKDAGAEPTALTQVSPARPAAQEPVVGMKAQSREMDEIEAADEAPADEKDRVAEKVAAKIAAMRRDLLLELGKTEAVRLYMGDGMPKALTLAPDYFFTADAAFRPGSDKLLNSLAALIFTLGKANCLILPEGSAEGDVKIKSIRRAIALNSFLESRGISKSRLEVNLTGTDVRFPKELTAISGLIILFDYDKQPRLQDLEDMRTKGPKVSLGIYPTAIAVHSGEGAIVEFAAFESPKGQPSWKFQIYEIQKDGSRLLLQEISGSGPQYNQSFWNGRKKFFGAPYPSGKYMFTVTAADMEGRETSISRLLLIKPTPEEEKAAQARTAAQKAASAETVSKAGVKTRSLSKTGTGMKAGKTLGGAGVKGKALKGAAGRKRVSSKAPAKKAKRKAEPEAEAPDGAEPSGQDAPAEAPSQPQVSGQVSYKIYFKENTTILTENSEKKLAQVAETLGYYPMANIQLTGYAYTGEANAEATAESRVNYVAARLAEKYKIDKARMEISSNVSDTPKSIVEIRMSGKE
jgi:outer membrane protein OmpA-like peptidoglycan-associated protein